MSNNFEENSKNGEVRRGLGRGQPPRMPCPLPTSAKITPDLSLLPTPGTPLLWH